MKRFILFNLVIILTITISVASKIEVKYAAKIAKNIYYERVNQIKDVKYDSFEMNLIYTEMYNNEPLYYIFNVNTNDGFVIISADNDAKPIIGYSFEGSFDLNNIPPSLDYFMDNNEKQLMFLKDNHLKASNEIANEWTELEVVTEKGVKDIQTIMPMLLTMWGQSGFYDDQCPVDNNGDVALVGCIAVSLGQVMKYYDHPAVGQGSNSYSYPSGWPTYWPYGTLSANFGNTNYNWANIPYDCTSANSDVARLLFHCGVAVEMMYGPTGSGSQMSNSRNALTSNFRYNATLIDRNNYSTTNWINTLKNEIDNERPIIYSGADPSQGGHAWNADGYQGNEFHMNWGWDGSANGYFSVDNLVAGGFDFSEQFSAIIGIYPVSGYPANCSGTKTVNGTSGSFNDGSGNQNYLNNLDCFYLIQPTCAQIVDFDFDVFQIESNDAVTFYNGASTSDPIIASYLGSEIPAAAQATNGAMLIEFSTDNTGNDIGWYGSYTTKMCSGVKVLTDPTGSISDGSGPCDYSSSTYCRWQIAPPGASSVTIDFTSFDLSSLDELDYVKIYKDAATTGNEVAILKNTTPPTGSIFVPSGVAWIKFYSNLNDNAGGWDLNYTSSTTDIDNMDLTLLNLSIYPNPFDNDATLSINLIENNNIDISVVNIIGEKVGSKLFTGIAGNNLIQLSEVVSSIDQGVYFVTFNINGTKLTRKVVCSK